MTTEGDKQPVEATSNLSDRLGAAMEQCHLKSGFDGGIGVRFVSPKDDRGNWVERYLTIYDLEELAKALFEERA